MIALVCAKTLSLEGFCVDITIALSLLAVWAACGLVAYFWLKNMQEEETWWSDHELMWVTSWRRPTPEMARKRFWIAFLGPIALLLLALVVVDDH